MATKLPGDDNTNKSKSGYEIRMDLLHLAHQIVENNTNYQMSDFHIKSEKRGGKIEKPPQYSVEQVIAHATELYRFVQQKS